MKKHHLLLAVALMSCATTFTSCDDDDDPYIYTLDFKRAELQYDANGVWSDVFTTESLYIEPFDFSHSGSSDYGGYFSGFTATKSTDSSYYPDMLAHQYDCIAGGASTGAGNPFLICYWNSSEADQTPLAQRSAVFCLRQPYSSNAARFTPRSMKICNSSYTYYTMQRGNNYARKFAQGDYLKVIAHGVKADGSETTSEYYLANCQGDEADWFVIKWQTWNLTSLGEVIAVYFTMESTDTGSFGINTPTYFAADAFEVESITNLL